MADKRIERRSINNSISGNDGTLTGYALKFNTWSNDLGGFIETIDPHALDNCDMSDVRCLIDHKPNQILGRTTNGSLKLEVDDVGLRFTVNPPDTSIAKDALENVRVGNINQCSFGFVLAQNGDYLEYNSDSKIYRRTLNNIAKLTDVSIVTYPAYTDTSVAVRSLDVYKKDIECLKIQLSLMKYEK